MAEDAVTIYLDEGASLYMKLKPRLDRDAGYVFMGDGRRRLHITLLLEGSCLSLHVTDEKYPERDPRRNRHLLALDFAKLLNLEVQEGLASAFAWALRRQIKSVRQLAAEGVATLVGVPHVKRTRGRRRVYSGDLVDHMIRRPLWYPWDVFGTEQEPAMYFAFDKQGDPVGYVYSFQAEDLTRVVFARYRELVAVQSAMLLTMLADGDNTDPEIRAEFESALAAVA